MTNRRTTAPAADLTEPDPPPVSTLDGVSWPGEVVPIPLVPGYLRDVYDWAYLNPENAARLDHERVVSVILWGNHRRLKRVAHGEFLPGQRVLQVAHVYGDFIPALARRLGPDGWLEVVDIAPLQVARCRNKLHAYPWVHVRRADARNPGGGPYDGICCYFLLHELPWTWKRAVVDALLAEVAPGGKAVFVDYHRPRPWNPLGPVMAAVFRRLEPYAGEMWENDIASLAGDPTRFAWRKETYFGGLYQKVVAVPTGPCATAPERA